MSEQKERIILCPKSLYRLLTGNFVKNMPIILPGLKKSGITIIPFWRERLLSLMPTQVISDLFNTNEKRNRKLSDLMNRTGDSPMSSDLKTAFNALLSTDGLLKIVADWMDFLSRNDCNAYVLAKCLTLYEEKCFAYDTAIPASVRTHLTSLCRETPENERKGGVSFLFEQAIHLAWLMLYAFHGRYMSLDVFRRLRTNPANSTNALWNMYTNITFGRRVPIVLTTRESIVCRQPLSQDSYLVMNGNPLALFDELLEKTGKVIVTGMGGIGKTELVRQAVKKIENSNRYARLAFVQYENSLCSSFRHAFPELSEIEVEQVIPQARQVLEQQGLGKTLLIVDNMDISDHDDPDIFALANYGCDIVITSRLSGLESFAILPIGAMNNDDAARLLEIVAPGITAEPTNEKQRLLDRVHGHPLSINMMGRLYANSHITLKELNEKLSMNGFEGLELNRYGQTVTILEMLRKTFGIAFRDKQNDKLLVLFSALHYEDYCVEHLRRILRDVDDSITSLANRLHVLSEFGWLEESNTGFAMHPVIAELFRPQIECLSSYPYLKSTLLEIAIQDPLAMTVLPDDFSSICELFASLPDNGCEELLALFPHLLLLLRAFPKEDAIFSRLLKKYQRITVSSSADNTHYWCCKIFEAYKDSLEHGITGLAKVEEEVMQNSEIISAEAIELAAILGLQSGVFILHPEDWKRFYECFYLKVVNHSAGIAIEVTAAQIELAMLNNPEKAESHLETAQQIIHQCSLENTAYEIEIEAVMGEILRNRGDYEQASSRLEKAMSAEYQRTGGTVSESIVDMVLALSDVYYKMGDVDKALNYYNFAIDNTSRICGEYGRNTLICMNNVCPIYVSLNQPERALEINKQVIERNEKVQVFSPAETANLYRNQGVYYKHAGFLREADTYMMKARDMYAQALGNSNVRVYDCELMHAANLLQLGNRRKACSILKRIEPEMRKYYNIDASMIELLNSVMQEAFPDFSPPDE